MSRRYFHSLSLMMLLGTAGSGAGLLAQAASLPTVVVLATGALDTDAMIPGTTALWLNAGA